jgi:hypothetical protein
MARKYLRTDNNLRVLFCHCYERRIRREWQYFAVCEVHKREVQEEWLARPWYDRWMVTGLKNTRLIIAVFVFFIVCFQCLVFWGSYALHNW